MTWGFRHWLLLALAAGVVAAYFGVLGPVQDVIGPEVTRLEVRAHVRVAQFQAKVQPKVATLEAKAHRLVQQPRVSEAFADPASGRGEAVMALLLFLVLTPIAAVMAFAVLLFLLTAVANVAGPWIGSQRVAMLVLSAGCAGLIYAERDLWLPDLTYLSGLVIRAYLVATQAA